MPGPLRAALRVVRAPSFRLGLVIAMVLAAGVLAVTGGLSVEAIRQSVQDLGAFGPIAFALIYVLAVVVLLPASPFTIAAGLLFGPVVGVITAWVGATIGATAAFLLGRAVGRGAVVQLTGSRVAAVDRYLSERGFAAMLIVRLVPLFPFNVVNLVAGISGLTLRDYVLATALGIVPGTVAFAALGGTIDDPTSPAFLGALALFVVVTLGAGLAARRLRSAGELPDA